jgi:hypothetical protein
MGGRKVRLDLEVGGSGIELRQRGIRNLLLYNIRNLAFSGRSRDRASNLGSKR